MSVRTDQVNMNVTINGERAGSTLNDLRRTARELKNELTKLPVASEEFRKKAAELGSVNKQLNSITHEIKGMGGAWQEIKKTFAGFTLAEIAIEGVAAIKDFAKESIKAYNEAAQAEAKLLNALDGQTDVQERLIQQAKDLQKTTIYQDDQIVAAQAFLAAQGHTEEQIKKTIAAAVQLASVTGIDLQTATQQLSGTYEGTIGRMGKLDSRIKDFSKTELANGAVIDLINEKYKGFAETAAKTGTGPLQQLGNEFNDLQETVGKYLLPAVIGVVQGFRWFMGLLEPMITAVDKLFEGLGLTGGSMWYFKTTIEVILSPIALFIKSITWLVETFNSIIPVISGVAAAFREYFKEVGEMASKVFGGIGQMIEGAFTLDWNKIKHGFADVKDGYAKMGSDIAQAYITAYRAKQKEMNSAGLVDLGTGDDNTEKSITKVGDSLDSLKNKLEELNKIHADETIGTNQFDETAKAIIAIQKKIDDATGKTKENNLKEHQKYLDKLERQHENYEQLLIDNMDEGADKERAILLSKYKKELEDYGLHYGDLNNLTEDQKLYVEALGIKYGKELSKIEKKYSLQRMKDKKKEGDDIVAETQQTTDEQKKIHLSFQEWFDLNQEKIRQAMDTTIEVLQRVANIWEQHFQSIIDNEEASAHERTKAAKHLKAMKIAEAGIVLAATLLFDGLSGQWQKFVKDAALGAIEIGTMIATPIQSYARGRITDGPELAQIGEDGTEALIPLSPKYRQQALPLFETAAQALGFQMGPQRVVSTAAIATAASGSGGGGRSDEMMMKMLYKMERTINKLNDRIDQGLPTYIEFNRFERDLKRIEAVRSEA